MNELKNIAILLALCAATFVFGYTYNDYLGQFHVNVADPTRFAEFAGQVGVCVPMIVVLGALCELFSDFSLRKSLAAAFFAGAIGQLAQAAPLILKVLLAGVNHFFGKTTLPLIVAEPYAINLGIYTFFWLGVFAISRREVLTLLKQLFLGDKNNSNDKESYRSKSGLFGNAQLGKWNKIKPIVCSTGNGVVVGEDYDPRENTKYFDVRDRKTWGKGGKAPLIRMDSEFDNGHILVFGASGSGKTASYIVPTCLEYMNSVIVVDPGPEKTALKVSAGIRTQKGRSVIEIGSGRGINVMALFEPFLDDPSEYYELAKLMIIEKRHDRFDEFYRDKVCNILAALLQYYHGEKKVDPFKEIGNFFGQDQDAMTAQIKKIAATAKAPEVAKRLNPYAKVDQEFFGYLHAVADTSLKWMVSERFQNMVNDKEGNITARTANMDLFLTLSLKEIATYPALVKLIVGTFAHIQLGAQEKGLPLVETFLIVDEAAQLKYFPLFERLRDLGRKPKMRMMLMYQSPAQMLNDDTFGVSALSEWSTVALTAYCGVDFIEEAKTISTIFGEMTVEHKETSYNNSGTPASVFSKSNSIGTSTRTQGVPIIRPEDILNLPKDAQILAFRSLPPFICGKAMYFRRKEWRLQEGVQEPQTMIGSLIARFGA